MDVTAQVSQPAWQDEVEGVNPAGWYVGSSCISGESPLYPSAQDGVVEAATDALSIWWSALDNVGSDPVEYTATRSATTSYAPVSPADSLAKVSQLAAKADAPPPPPRHWTRLSIKTALAQAGMLAAAREYLTTVAIADGYSAWEALTDCDYIEEGYPDAKKWSAILDGAAQALGRTRAEIDAFLDSIPTEGGV